MPRYNLTVLRLYIGALDCSVPSPVRYSQARTFSTIITTIKMKENIANTSTSPKETRSVFVGAKVTPSQREHIKSLAEQCGMTVSDCLRQRYSDAKVQFTIVVSCEPHELPRLTEKHLLTNKLYLIIETFSHILFL